jgi:outer membrane murein-binding lipoprotein Lpp
MSCMRHIDHLDSCVGCAQEDRKTAAARISQLESENGKLRAQLEAARELAEAAQTASRLLDGIKYELSGSVYTLTDDEFDGVFDARDRLDAALAKWKEAGR